MLKERANALKEQEVQLGAMLAQLQMDKAKEVMFVWHILFYQTKSQYMC